jgi:heat shock protein HslJ
MNNKPLRRGPARAGIFLASLALAACASPTPASSAAPRFTGYDWQVVAIGHDGEVTNIPARAHVLLQFTPDGHIGANDGTNFHSGTYRATGDSFTTGPLVMTAMLYGGNDQALLVAGRAMDSLESPSPVTYPVRLSGDQLVVDMSSYTLTCHRAGHQANYPAPASTG